MNVSNSRLCLTLSCVALYSRTSTTCSIWYVPHAHPPAPRSPPAATATSPRRTRQVPRWVKCWLETSFHTFHHHHSTFHHPAHCCTPSLRFEGEKYLQLTVTFTALDELPSSTCWSAAVATYRREQWWSQAEGWSLPLSSDVFTGYAQVKKIYKLRIITK